MCVTDAWLQLQKKLVDARLELLAELGAEHLLPLYRRLKVSALRITYIMSSVQISNHHTRDYEPIHRHAFCTATDRVCDICRFPSFRAILPCSARQQPAMQTQA